MSKSQLSFKVMGLMSRSQTQNGVSEQVCVPLGHNLICNLQIMLVTILTPY